MICKGWFAEFPFKLSIFRLKTIDTYLNNFGIEIFIKSILYEKEQKVNHLSWDWEGFNIVKSF